MVSIGLLLRSSPRTSRAVPKPRPHANRAQGMRRWTGRAQSPRAPARIAALRPGTPGALQWEWRFAMALMVAEVMNPELFSVREYDRVDDALATLLALGLSA